MSKFYFEVIIVIKCLVFAYSSPNINNCIVHIDGFEIDVSVLNNAHGYEVLVEKNTFILNICGPASKCKHDSVSACIVADKGDIKIIGSSSKFKSKHARFTYKYNKSVETIIDLKCNRHFSKTPYIKYDSQPTQGKVYKFTFYTSLVCINKPLTCQVIDDNNLQYNIDSLNDPNQNWVVRNVSNGLKIYLNICGSLNFIQAINVACTYENTQICMINQNRNATNLGVYSRLIINDNGLTVNFTGGSLCSEFETITTKLDLICSFNDTGPILMYSSDCKYIIEWHTPSACPFQKYVNKNCILSNPKYGNQNDTLYSSRDQEQQFSNNLKIKYNICGSLQECKGTKDVSFCLIQNDTEIILGMQNKTIITKDASVYINLTGEMCKNKKNRTVNINFHCDYTPNKLESISLSNNSCSATVNVFTKKVCRQPDIPSISCKHSINETHYYDLTALSLLSRNIEFNVSLITYILNICEPLIINSNAMCSFGTAICLRNNTEPNKYKRYKSIGDVQKTSGLEMENNKLFIKYESGIICPGLTTKSNNYESTIEFKCIEESQKPEITVSHTVCEYNFVYESPHACLITKIIASSVPKNESNIPVKNIVKTQHTDTTVNHIHEIGEIITEKNERITKNKKQESNKQMRSNKIVKEIFDVEETEIHTEDKKFEKTKIKNETLTFQKSIESDTISMYVPIEVPNSAGIFIKNCTITDNESNKFNMYGLSNITHIASKSGKIYSVNICPSKMLSDCGSIRCLTNVNITLNKQFVIVNFKDQNICNNKSPYMSWIYMKCSNDFQDPVVLQENQCSVEILWKNKAACSFIKGDTKDLLESHSNSATVVACTISVLIVIGIVAAVTGRYYFKKHQSDSTLHLLPISRCEYSKVKDFAKIE